MEIHSGSNKADPAYNARHQLKTMANKLSFLIGSSEDQETLGKPVLPVFPKPAEGKKRFSLDPNSSEDGEQSNSPEANGVDATPSPAASASEVIELVSIDKIDDPRVPQRWLYPKEKVAAMAVAIMQEGNGDALKGQLQPVILVPSETPGRYEMVEGLTRLKAFREHYLSPVIKAIIRRDIGKAEAYRIGFTCNESRNAPTDYDKGMSFARALSFGLYQSQDELAEHIGVSKATLSQYMKFSKLPDFVHEIITESPTPFTYNVAAAINTICDRSNNDIELVTSIATKVAKGSMNGAQLKAFVATYSEGSSEKKRKPRKSVCQIPNGKIRYGEGTVTLESTIPVGLEERCAIALQKAFDDFVAQATGESSSQGVASEE